MKRNNNGHYGLLCECASKCYLTSLKVKWLRMHKTTSKHSLMTIMKVDTWSTHNRQQTLSMDWRPYIISKSAVQRPCFVCTGTNNTPHLGRNSLVALRTHTRIHAYTHARTQAPTHARTHARKNVRTQVSARTQPNAMSKLQNAPKWHLKSNPKPTRIHPRCLRAPQNVLLLLNNFKWLSKSMQPLSKSNLNPVNENDVKTQIELYLMSYI